MIDMVQVADALLEIESTSSTLEKERLLRKHADLEGFKDILHFIFNPYSHTGLKKKKLEKFEYYDIEDKAIPAEEVMEYFGRNNTGSDADAIYAMTFICNQETDEACTLAAAMVTNDLQIGVSVTTLNKVFGKSFIPYIGIMRGSLAPPDFTGEYIVTEKIDGNRRLIMVRESGVEVYTRSGKRDYGLVDIEADAAKLPVGFVYDTECISIGEYFDSIDLRQASASILNSKGTRTGVKALCFDVIPLDEYAVGKSSLSALGRKGFLAGIFNDKLSRDILCCEIKKYTSNIVDIWMRGREMGPAHRPKYITSLPILGVVHNMEEAMKITEPIWETGGEGTMLVDTKSPYEVNPNPRKTLLKLKATKEIKLMCVDVVEGNNKYAGTLGAIVVEYMPHKNNLGAVYTVKVGSGFADYQRDMYWNNPHLIVGHMVELDTFGESRNAAGDYSLNCPIFKRVCGEED